MILRFLLYCRGAATNLNFLCYLDASLQLSKMSIYIYKNHSTELKPTVYVREKILFVCFLVERKRKQKRKQTNKASKKKEIDEREREERERERKKKTDRKIE